MAVVIEKTFLCNVLNTPFTIFVTGEDMFGRPRTLSIDAKKLPKIDMTLDEEEAVITLRGTHGIDVIRYAVLAAAKSVADKMDSIRR